MSTPPRNPVHRLFNQKQLRDWLRRLRIPLAIAAAIWVAWQSKAEWFWPGLAVSVAGELIQLWCFGCLHKQKELATNGPYKVVRNPMYLGRFLLVFGCVMFLGNWIVLAVFVVVYYFYMVNRVRREEERLVELLGEPYQQYCRQVSRFLPFQGVSSIGSFWFFRMEYFTGNHGQWNGLGQLVYYAICYFATFRV